MSRKGRFRPGGRATWKKPRRISGNSYRDRQLVLHRMGFNTYAEYLASDLWKHIRAKVFKCKGRVCHLCGDAANQVHHNRYGYAEMMGFRIKRLAPLCGPCHEAIEFTSDGQKRSAYGARKQFTKRRADISAHTIAPVRAGIPDHERPALAVGEGPLTVVGGCKGHPQPVVSHYGPCN